MIKNDLKEKNKINLLKAELKEVKLLLKEKKHKYEKLLKKFNSLKDKYEVLRIVLAQKLIKQVVENVRRTD